MGNVRTIHKFPIGQPIEAPADAKVVLIGAQGNRVCVWLEIETTKPTARRLFSMYGTGHPIPDSAVHVGSFQDGSFVWHIYERVLTDV